MVASAAPKPRRVAGAVGAIAFSPAARKPVPPPTEHSTWEEELWKLQRLYSQNGDFEVENDSGEAGMQQTLVSKRDSASSSVGGGSSSSSSKCGHTNSARIVRLTLHCTDPDWDATNWAPDGLRLMLVIPITYPEAITPLPSLSILSPEGLPERFKMLVPSLFEEAVSRAQPHTPAVYRALQYVDRYLVPLWVKLREAALKAEEELRKAEERRAKVQAHISALKKEVEDPVEESISGDQPSAGSIGASRVRESTPWTAEEQSQLEQALVEFSEERDMKRRWQMIARRLGGTRTARECAERYRSCREFALGRSSSVQQAEEEAKEVAPRPTPVVTWSAADVRRQGVEVRLIGLVLEGFATMLPGILRLDVVCDRCKKPTSLEAEVQGAQSCSTESPCPTCKQVVGLRVAPNICHGGCAAIAHVLGVSCHPTDLLRSDVVASCGECTEPIRIRNVGPGYRRRSDCPSCFSKLNLAVEGSELLGSTVAHWRQVASEEGEKVSARKQLQEARRQEKAMGVQVGQPLPDRGVCKHYSKSYRWLRFPCCGRAFPCDECHDEQADHPHEWATRMLCGSCSHEQPFSKDKCAHCGASQTRARSSYWEGGEGCRNRTMMSKSDTHKYKGLGKTVSQKAASSMK